MKDHRFYITTEENFLSLDNISFSAEINNYSFINGCEQIDEEIIANVTLLFILKPDKAENKDIVLPYFIGIADNQKIFFDLQYYKAEGILELNKNRTSYAETEVRTTNKIIIPLSVYKNIKNKIIIGFMLSEEKQKILNLN